MLRITVVLAQAHRRNAARGPKIGSNNSGVEEYLTGNKKTWYKTLHLITEANRTLQTRNKSEISVYT